MRKNGSTTKKKCWKLIIHNFKKELVLSKDYSTLKEIATELGYTYNVVVEMSNGRKKGCKGRYDSSYEIIKLSSQEAIEEDLIIGEG